MTAVPIRFIFHLCPLGTPGQIGPALSMNTVEGTNGHHHPIERSGTRRRLRRATATAPDPASSSGRAAANGTTPLVSARLGHRTDCSGGGDRPRRCLRRIEQDQNDDRDLPSSDRRGEGPAGPRPTHTVRGPTRTVTVPGPTKTVTTTVNAPPTAAPSSSGSSGSGNSGSTAPSSSLTISQQNAVASAKGYLSTSGFSRQGLIDQLSSSAGEGYPVGDATVAVDSLNVDWNAQAVRSAKSYLQTSSFSCQGLIDQLSSSAGEQFTVAQAQYAANKVGLC